MAPIFLIGLIGVIVLAIVLVIVGLRSPEATDPLQARLAEASTRSEVVSLEELELSLPFNERVLLPIVRAMGQFAARFTPQATLEGIQHKLDLAGNPANLDPTAFWAIRIVASLLFGGLVIALFIVAPGNIRWTWTLGLTVLFLALGYFFPDLWIRSKIRKRQDDIIKAMPDALDLLTICVGAGLGFEAAMAKVNEKWDNEVARGFGRVINEVRLGKLRREALRDMADRMDVPEMTSFVAAVVQSEQLGVSLSNVLGIQSEQMRVRRRQRAEEKAHQAPIKMIIAMALLTFPSICIILMGPAVLILLQSALRGVLFGG